MKRKTFISFLIASLVLTLSYSAFLFLPYFADANRDTHAINHLIYGYQLGFGQSGQPDVKILGNGFLLIAQLAGIAAGLFCLVFFFLYVFRKKDNPFIYFILGLTIPGLAFAFASIVLAWPIYQNLNASASSIPVYTWEYFVTLFATAIALLINCFCIVYTAVNRQKKGMNPTK